MGIKGLYQFIRKKFPQVYTTVHLSEFAYKKVAIDISLYVYKYKSVNMEGNLWLSMIINLVACLRENNIHCVFIYDTGFPEEKKLAHEKRREHRKKLQEHISELEQSLEIYNCTGEISESITKFATKKGNDAYSVLTGEINMDFVERAISKKGHQNVSVTDEDFKTTKELFDILNIPYFQAVSEKYVPAERRSPPPFYIDYLHFCAARGRKVSRIFKTGTVLNIVFTLS